jgi:hypothetical protein
MNTRGQEGEKEKEAKKSGLFCIYRSTSYIS